MVINSSCDVLIAKKELDEYTRQKIDSISKSANEIRGLVEAFLALARGEDSHPEMATLNSIVESDYQTWLQLAAKKGNRFLLQEEAENAEQEERKYPAILLRTVLGNLIRNANHHTAEGEIVLVLRPGGFDLRDTGSGIAAEERAQVFKPYYRGTTSHRDGLGLGLSLVQRICERENWTVALEENQPSGCCFRVNFL
jgi:signal transduction histidine kinase